jgi:hypothetical protein
MRQMPTEGKMFRAVDNTWRVSMAQTFSEPSCIKVARRPGFLDSLVEANAKLEQIQKGLNDYLETKRLAFPRFFFLSNDELLEILAETKDPLRVQPHLKKCFDGIAKLQFQANLDITACFDPKNEKLDFPYDKVHHKKINPNDSGGNVEKWLIEVEAIMKKSLAYAIDTSMTDYLKSDRIEWVKRWQGQVIIAINQIRWSFDVERVLNAGPEAEGLHGYYQKLCDELMRTVELVRGDIPKQLRTAIGALVVMDVHNRDTVHEMAEMNVGAVTDFDWLCQMRYYWNNAGESAMSGKPGSIQCKMINAMALYAYEYLGNQDRLVVTPLTDRCYRTLMGAIHLNLGGAPEGPAGTGKTETVKGELRVPHCPSIPPSFRVFLFSILTDLPATLTLYRSREGDCDPVRGDQLLGRSGLPRHGQVLQGTRQFGCLGVLRRVQSHPAGGAVRRGPADHADPDGQDQADGAVRLRGHGAGAQAHVLPLHHHEPRVRRPRRAAGQPQGSLPHGGDDGPRLCDDL